MKKACPVSAEGTLLIPRLRVQLLSRVRLFGTHVAQQAPQSMGFPRQEYWSGLPFPPPGDVPDPGIEPASPVSPALQAESSPPEQVDLVSWWATVQRVAKSRTQPADCMHTRKLGKFIVTSKGPSPLGMALLGNKFIRENQKSTTLKTSAFGMDRSVCSALKKEMHSTVCVGG